MLIIYIWVASLAGTYYTYQDYRTSNSFLSAFFISPVYGFFKGFAWPYYITVSVIEKTKPLDDNLENYIYGVLSLSHITQVASDNALNPNSELAQIKHKYWVQTALNFFKKCDLKKLDSYYSGWGQSTGLLVEALETITTDENKSRKLLSRFSDWGTINQNQISKIYRDANIKNPKLPSHFIEMEPAASAQLDLANTESTSSKALREMLHRNETSRDK